MSKTMLIVAVGPDRAGLANALTHEISEAGCTIQQTYMETIGGYFPMLLEIKGSEDGLAKIRRQVAEWEAGHELDISIYEDRPTERPSAPGRSYSLRVDSIERAGIIYDVTRVLRKVRANVYSLEGGLEDMPFSGELRFVLKAEVEIPEDRHSEVEESLDRLDLDYHLSPK